MIDTIFNEDCLTGMSRIPRKSVDCIICDLPYGTIACPWDSVLPLDELWRQYNRILKPQGSALLFGSEPFSSHLRMSNIAHFKYDWIWHKTTMTGFQHAKNMPLKDFEIISVFSNASMGHATLLGDKRMNYYPQDVVEINKTRKKSQNQWGNIAGARPSHKETYTSVYENYPTMTLEFSKDADSWHPTQKPVDLIRYLIRTYTSEGDTVLDNCMGSGTTGVACIKEHRSFIGFELNPDYYQRARERLKTEEEQLTLF